MIKQRQPSGLIRHTFDYENLPASKRRQAQQEAGSIRRLLEKTAVNIVQIGLRLQLVRESLGREYFQEWLRGEFQWSQSVASNYMRAAVAFSGLDCLEHFQPSALYVLARRKVSPEARNDAIRLAREGELITRRRAEDIVQKHSGEIVARSGDEIRAVRNGTRRLIQRLRELDRERLRAAADDLAELVRELESVLEAHEH